MQRRLMLKTATAGLASLLLREASGAGEANAETTPFQLGYAPHPGMFRNLGGSDVIDQIKFCADQGFTAFEYNGLPGESPQMQERIGKTSEELGTQMGVFVAYASFDRPTFVRPREETTAEILEKMREAVTVAKRVGAKCCTVVPGSVDQQHEDDEWNRYGGPRLAAGYQTANVIGMEHGNSRAGAEGERKVIEAYRKADAF